MHGVNKGLLMAGVAAAGSPGMYCMQTIHAHAWQQHGRVKLNADNPLLDIHVDKCIARMLDQAVSIRRATMHHECTGSR